MKFMRAAVFLETAYQSKSGTTGTGQKWRYTRPVEHSKVEPRDEASVYLSKDQTIERSQPRCAGLSFGRTQLRHRW